MFEMTKLVTIVELCLLTLWNVASVCLCSIERRGEVGGGRIGSFHVPVVSMVTTVGIQSFDGQSLMPRLGLTPALFQH